MAGQVVPPARLSRCRCGAELPFKWMGGPHCREPVVAIRGSRMIEWYQVNEDGRYPTDWPEDR